MGVLRLCLLVAVLAACVASALPVWAAPPVIEDVKIDRGRDTNSAGLVSYHQRVSAKVTVVDQTVACVVINDPDGGQYALSVCAQGGWWDWPGASVGNDMWFWITEDPTDYTVNLIWLEANRLVPPPPGSYQIRVLYGDCPVCFDTPPAPPVEDTYPEVAYPARDGVVGETLPTFQWSNPAGSRYLQLTYAPSPQARPAIDGHRIVWQDGRDAVYGIRFYDLEAKEYQWIAQGYQTQVLPAISGDKIVWLDDTADNWGFYTKLYDLATGAQFVVSENPTIYADPAYLWPPAIEGSLIAYSEPTGRGSYNLRLYDLSVDSDGDGVPNWRDDDTPSPDPARRQLGGLSTVQHHQRISGRRIVYVDACSGNDDIYLYDLDLDQAFQLSMDPSPQETPDISGDLVVWADHRSPDADLYLYDLSVDSDGNGIPNWQEPVRPDPDPALRKLTDDPADQSNPAVDGNLVAWQDRYSGEWISDILAYDLSSQQLIEVVRDAHDQMYPAVANGMVAWQDDRMGTFWGWPNWDIFAWGPAVEANSIQVKEEGSLFHSDPLGLDGGQVWAADTGDATAVAYDFDNSATRPELLPGYAYFWQVNSWRLDADSPHDLASWPWENEPRVQMWTSQLTYARFSEDVTWPALPDLPGRLGYDVVGWGDWSYDSDSSMSLQYGTDIATRKWLGPECTNRPSWSWDGTQLLHRINDFGLWIAAPDGTQGTRIPNEDAWSEAGWSPDATHVLYLEAADPNWTMDAWTQKADGSDRRLLVAARGLRVSRPHWSPDGAWIAYTTCCDPSGYNVWLIRPDGTQDHPVIPTTVAGHPGWTIDWFANGAFWSPDAKRLVATFSATSPDRSEYINAMGTISRDGGEVTPMWINPPGAICCAAAFPSAWSPDGNSIVFASGFHLRPDPEWANGKFEPGIELWMRNADGSGEPTRLTYDYSYPESASWWAPDTPVGRGVAVCRGDATLTFAQVTAEGSTRVNVTFDVPGPAPAGYSFASDVWSGATTAGYQGDIAVALKYDASLAGREEALALLEWSSAKGKWQDITVRPIDKQNRVIQGRTRELGAFVVVVKAR